MKTRGTATDKLVDVIQALQLVRKTGLLTAQRDADDIAEVGMIAFRDGQVIDASVGQMRGADAFKKLVMWTRCHFVFEPASPASPPLAAHPPLGQEIMVQNREAPKKFQMNICLSVVFPIGLNTRRG